MAISTPAQNPRGAARRTRSTGIAPRLRGWDPDPPPGPAASSIRNAGGSAVILSFMSAARIVAVAPGSPAARAGLVAGDHVVRINGHVPRDIIQYRVLTDDADVSIDIDRGGLGLTVEVPKAAGEPL